MAKSQFQGGGIAGDVGRPTPLAGRGTIVRYGEQEYRVSTYHWDGKQYQYELASDTLENPKWLPELPENMITAKESDLTKIRLKEN